MVVLLKPTSTSQGANYSKSDLGLTDVDCITIKSERRLEEAPFAYKPIQIQPVINAQIDAGMVQEVARLQPLLTFKA